VAGGSGASGLDYYWTTPVCISAVIRLLAVWRYTKPKTIKDRGSGMRRVTKTTVGGIFVLMPRRSDLFHDFSETLHKWQSAPHANTSSRSFGAEWAIYGVSAPLQSAPKQKHNADVHRNVKALCKETQHACAIVMGDLNTVTRDNMCTFCLKKFLRF